jgi:hypothetical protein
MAESTNLLWDIQLQEGQIRLFNIQLDDGDQVKGSPEIFDHGSAPEYIAQSYVCGESPCDTKITVNGNSLYIKANLSIALQQTKKLLRQRSAGKRLSARTSITRLWIDAVCINQSNPKELEVQIRFMENKVLETLDLSRACALPPSVRDAAILRTLERVTQDIQLPS